MGINLVLGSVKADQWEMQAANSCFKMALSMLSIFQGEWQNGRVP